MTESLKHKAAKGIIWKFIEQGGTQLIQFIAGIYIARILSPEDYGLVGMLAIFLGISQMFIDSGLRATLIQKGENVSHDDYNVVFIFNIAVSILLYLLIFFGASSIAEFYNEPRLIWVARMLGLNLIFLSFGIIHQTILEKKLNFRTITKIRLVSIFVSVIIGILMAMEEYGVWALIIMTLSESLIRTVLIWFYNKWKPSLYFNREVFKELFVKGIQLVAAGFVQQVNQNLYAMVIGKAFSTADVGFYDQGKKMQKRVGDFINSSIQGVMYPVQALMKDDISRLKNAVRKNVRITSLIIFPFLIGLISVANPFILLFLTEKWLPSVYFLQILSVAGIIYVVSSSASSFLLPLGKFGFFARYSVFNNILLIVIITAGVLLKVDLKILVLGKVLHESVNLIVFIFYSKKMINYGAVEIISDVFIPLSASLVMGILIYFMGNYLGYTYLGLTVQVFSGIFIYMLLNLIFNRKMFFEILSMAISFKGSNKLIKKK